MLVFVAATTPFVFVTMIRVWPHTPIGRRILNRHPGQENMPGLMRTLPDGTPLAELIGQIGIARTDLLPSGQVLINNQKIDAVSIGMPIDAGKKIIVTTIQTGKVQVREATLADLDKNQASPTEERLSPLESTLDTFDLDSLE